MVERPRKLTIGRFAAAAGVGVETRLRMIVAGALCKGTDSTLKGKPSRQLSVILKRKYRTAIMKVLQGEWMFGVVSGTM